MGKQLKHFVVLVFFTAMVFSGFQYYQSGQITWYVEPLNTARTAYVDVASNFIATNEIIAEGVELSGHVSRITDGDTLTLNDSQIIRFYGIDAPERDQPYGSRATNALRLKLTNQDVRVVVQDIDDYGRFVGTVYLNDRNINQEMVAEGHAWWYEFFAPNNQELRQAQSKAQEQNLGLWNDPNPVDPYEWRRTH